MLGVDVANLQPRLFDPTPGDALPGVGLLLGVARVGFSTKELCEKSRFFIRRIAS